MFERLRKKWKVNGLQLGLIICTFAIGGSLTGFAGKKIMNALAIQQDWLWTIIYIILITLLWPMAVLLVSIFFGQFRFFLKYIKKIGARMGIVQSQKFRVGSRESGVQSQEFRVRSQKSESVLQVQQTRTIVMSKIAIFASGAGSNAKKIIDHFRDLPPKPSPSRLPSGERGADTPEVKVALIVSNNPDAGVLKIAAKENIPALIIKKEKFFRGNAYLDELKEKQIDFIVLAGFLWKIPDALLKAYPVQIINIHPALLPKYGGKGMYGNNIHEAVIAAREKESGITIHYVDEHYDNGDIILQIKCPVLENDTPDSLAERIHKLEHEHYPKAIEKLLTK
jgi:formyltetrahydrofolate-dependent phosphoribosylglycinamide formyltransferase